MTASIRVDCAPGEARVAVWEAGALRDYALWRPGAPDGVGDLLRGRVIAHVPPMAGAFVALPDAEGFLPDSAGGAGARAGVAIGVRVVRAAQGGKGPRLTARLAADDARAVGAGPPALLRRGPAPVERLAALWPDAAVTVSDPAVAAALRASLGVRCSVGQAFDDAVEVAADALCAPVADLPGGARLHIHPTPALTALDVDLAGATAGRACKASAQQAANAALIPALALQLRLRNLGGAILVDFGGMSIRRRAALGAPLAAALAGDPLTPRFLGFTALGLAEIMRPRVHPPLHELLAGAHAQALAALRAAEARVREAPGHAPRLVCAPPIHAALLRDAVACSEYARRTGHAVDAVSDPAQAPPGWRIA